jgi:hypothetical protein
MAIHIILLEITYNYGPPKASDNTQNIITLLLVAVISGFALPALLKLFEVISNQKINRIQEIRKMQLEILEQLTRTIWNWRFLAKQICYYGDYKTSYEKNELNKAIENYDKKVWKLFTEIKAIKSRSFVWFDKYVPKIIEELYNYIKTIDGEIARLIIEVNANCNGRAVSMRFQELEREFTDKVSKEIEKQIDKIAKGIRKPKLYKSKKSELPDFNNHYLI